MKLIQITDEDGYQYMVNTDHIVFLCNNNNTTTVKLSSGLEITTYQPYIALAERIAATQISLERDKILKD
jgi:hypothetical protein